MVETNPLTGYTPQYEINNSGSWITGTQTGLISCPSGGTVTVNWRYRPNLGNITIHAKQATAFICDPNIGQMNALAELSGVEFELVKSGGGTNIKSWPFANSNAGTESQPTGSVWNNAVIPGFTHFLCTVLV